MAKTPEQWPCLHRNGGEAAHGVRIDFIAKALRLGTAAADGAKTPVGVHSARAFLGKSGYSALHSSSPASMLP
jgi:hypothetical protein